MRGTVPFRTLGRQHESDACGYVAYPCRASVANPYENGGGGGTFPGRVGVDPRWFTVRFQRGINQSQQRDTTKGTIMSSNYVTRTEFNALASDVSRILAILDPAKPAKVVKAPAKKATKAVRIATPSKGKTTTVTRKSAPLLRKQHAWARGLSTQVIASMLVEDPSLAPGWVVGPRYTEMFSA